jgi:2-oxoglutarate dehydrogenase E2 component (dihydrolipoamide succinyltransferase)
VPSPVSGVLAKQLCNENDVVQVGSVIAEIETGATAEQNSAPAAPAPEPAAPAYKESFPANDVVEFEDTAIPGVNQLTKEEPAVQAPAYSNGDRFYSPLVKNIAAQERITMAELDRIPGTGSDGRLTKDDLLNYISKRQPVQGNRVPTPQPKPQPQGQPARPSQPQQNIAPSQPQAAAAPKPTAQQPQPPKPAQAAPQQAPKPAQAAAQPKPAYIPAEGDEIIEMDRMRRLIADHMVMSKHVSPHVTSFVEADVTNLVQWRDKVKKEFEKRENEKITFTPIFIEAVVKAIRDFPGINVSVSGDKIIKRKNINIGMAAALPSGNLIVPVIRNADTKNLLGLTKEVNELANRARGNALKPDEIQGATFTVTNVGTFGNVMGTPIISQPQVAILALGAIKKKPVVMETEYGDIIAIRQMMFLSLSYDHRVVDGMLGGSFLRRIADYLEAFDPNRAV